MQVKELYEQVAQLGFEAYLEDDNRFYFAANRALLQVNSLRPAISAFVINHKPMKNLIKMSSFLPVEKKSDLYFEAFDAKAYYFEADGNGSLYIEKQNEQSGEWMIIGSKEFTNSSRNFIPQRGFIKQDGSFTSGHIRLHFLGDYLYSVKNVAMYEYVFSDREGDIPAYEPYARYNLSVLATDFLSMNSPLIVEDEHQDRLNQGYDVEGGTTILLPHSLQGCYKVLYNRMPRKLENTGDAKNDMTVIDADEEICSLMPTLIASYVWAEDEPSLAEYYLSLYRERAYDIERRSKNVAPAAVKNVNGW